jgi:Protein of unknown function (DUF2855)
VVVWIWVIALPPRFMLDENGPQAFDLRALMYIVQSNNIREPIMTATSQSLDMNRAAIGDTTLVDDAHHTLQDGQARLALKRFSLTANNVTYAVFGDMMAYWNFFPASTDGCGRVPVWGFADVVESKADGVAVGMRVYGYFPMSQHLVVTPVKASANGFMDATEHRQPMAAAYNRYEAVSPADADTEGRVALLKPLFITGFLLDDWISGEKAWGASNVIASSASSKTALSMAACLKRRGGVSVTGLTSARSKAFVEASGYYDKVVTYDDLGALAGTDSAYVDFAGDAEVTRGVHETLGDNLKASVIVGGSHWDADRSSRAPMPGPKPEMFFAPTHIGRLGASWGGAEFARAVNAALDRFAHDSRGWLEVHESAGLPAAQAAWARLLANDVSAKEGIVIVL